MVRFLKMLRRISVVFIFLFVSSVPAPYLRRELRKISPMCYLDPIRVSDESLVTLFRIYNLRAHCYQLLFQTENLRFQELDVTVLKLGNTLFTRLSLREKLALKKLCVIWCLLTLDGPVLLDSSSIVVKLSSTLSLYGRDVTSCEAGVGI